MESNKTTTSSPFQTAGIATSIAQANGTPAPQKPATIAAAVRSTVAIPPSLRDGTRLRSTNSLSSGFFRCLLFGYPDSYKTVTAAHFGTPENTRIICMRREEQLIPLKGEDYKYITVRDIDEAKFALQHPETLWPDWSALKDKTLILDDGTELKDLLLEDADESRDRRQMYKEAKDDMRDILASAMRKDMNLIFVALARETRNNVLNKDVITPDLPPSMAGLVQADFEYVFYIDRPSKKLITTQVNEIVTKRREDGKGTESYQRIVMGKHKLPFSLVGKKVLEDREALDLRAVWAKVREAQK